MIRPSHLAAMFCPFALISSLHLYWLGLCTCYASARSTWPFISPLISYNISQTYTHSHFSRYTLLVPSWTSFCLQNCLNYLWHRFNKALETFLRDFPYFSILSWEHHAVAADLSAAHPWCDSPIPPHPKDVPLDWDLVIVEATGVQWTHCHVQETSLRWFELCDMACYSAIKRWVHCGHKGMDMVSNNTQVGCGV